MTTGARTYHGERNAATDHPADRGSLVIYVREQGAARQLRHVVLHSPTGLEWGYTGSGPGDLALSLLADALDLDDEAALKGEPRLAHEPFKRQIVSQLGHHGWTLGRDEVLQWLKSWRGGSPLPPDACDVCGAPHAAVRAGDTFWCEGCWNAFGDPEEDES